MLTFSPQLLIQTLVVTFTLLTGSQAFAASACKGQTNTACNQTNSCYWVAGYKRSDGANVKSHCRSKPKSSLKSSAEKATKKSSSVKNASADSANKTQKSDMKVVKELSKKDQNISGKTDTKKQSSTQ